MLTYILAAAIIGIAAIIMFKPKGETLQANGAVPPPWFVWNYIIPFTNWLSIAVPNALSPPQFRMMELVSGYALTRALHTLAMWNVPDEIKKGGANGMPLAKLAKAIKVPEESLDRIIRHAINSGVFSEVGGKGSRVYINNALSDTLTSDSPISVLAVAQHLATDAYACFTEMEYAATKKPSEPTAATKVFGDDLWTVFNKNPKLLSTFARAMTAIDTFSMQALLEDYPWTRHTRFIDIGASLGTVLKRVMRLTPGSTGVLFDLPKVIPEAKKVWAQENADLADRVTFEEGSFFTAVPEAKSDSDAYILRNILHDWNDEKTTIILNNLRKACGKFHPSVLIIETNPEDPADSIPTKSFLDLQMMCVIDGKERSVERHWKPLFKETGFKIKQMHNTRSMFRVLEITPA